MAGRRLSGSRNPSLAGAVDPTAEGRRLSETDERRADWKRWGPYLSERQWGTVREDYSEDGESWRYFTHDQARSRVYRWGEDGLLGIADRRCRLCFAVALWNGKDPILKERFFGLTGLEGNHGEDVKESYFYLDATPSHAYLKALYKYPQAEFPYRLLLEENRRRGRNEPEFELEETGVFDGNRYFDLTVEYAQAAPEDILIRLTVHNRGPEAALLHLLPTLWFRNTWSWGRRGEGFWPRPLLRQERPGAWVAKHASLGTYRFFLESIEGQPRPEPLFTENETNTARLYQSPNPSPYVKDAIHDYVIYGRREAVHPERTGTKAAADYRLRIPAGGGIAVRLRLVADCRKPNALFGPAFDQIFSERIREADAFYAAAYPSLRTDQERRLARQASAGLIWSKQFYHYVVKDWLEGDPSQPPAPAARRMGRNADWPHLYNRDVISMPDKWEYPWYAAWDLAFHMIPFARMDPAFAKEQLILMLREWYLHPSGQLPAYEFGFSDVNPPVHAWACWRVYKMTGPRGGRDRLFLSRVFHKLLINFTWWVNRKDLEGKHLFSGGFLGLDNIGVFDRSKPLPTGGSLEQADGTAWMAFYCATMLSIALELARQDPAYEDVASKFFEHFVAIVDAMNALEGGGLWDEADGFYYDRLHLDGRHVALKVRSLVGLIPLLAVEILEEETLARLPGFSRRMHWFLENRQDLARHIAYLQPQVASQGPQGGKRLLAIPSQERLLQVMRYLLDEQEFLCPYGIRSVSRFHEGHPYHFSVDGSEYRVEYLPGESNSGLFGGNSNWRGPVWFPINYLLIEALERYHHFYGDRIRVECPTGSGRWVGLQGVADELARRLTQLFLPDARGRRPCHGAGPRFAEDPHWRGLVLFHEYFHAESGRGLGASHQTGWTALVLRCLEASARSARSGNAPRGKEVVAA